MALGLPGRAGPVPAPASPHELAGCQAAPRPGPGAAGQHHAGAGQRRSRASRRRAGAAAGLARRPGRRQLAGGWLASGADGAGAGWTQLAGGWLEQARGPQARGLVLLAPALVTVVCADIIRPSPGWLVAGGCDHAGLARAMAASRDPAGFAQLRALGERDRGATAARTARTLRRAAVILAAKGGVLAGITIGDVLELLDTEAEVFGAARSDAAACYRLLREMGIFGPAAPARLRELRTAGQRTPAEMIGRHQLTCQPIRDLLVDYLRERQPAMDYGSLEQLARRLGMFWADLEAHHPGIDSLHLSAEVADAWKQRMRTKQTTIAGPGGKTVVDAERICHREFLTPVRAFYLDLAQWAVDDPARWAQWAVPCPVGRAETIQGKIQRHRKSRMDARTRERLPVLPILVRSTAQQHADAQALLHAACGTRPGDTFTAAGAVLVRSVTTASAVSVWADDPATGSRRNLTAEEDRAFWAWATVEILRATGIRAEELIQLSHHSLVQYRLPGTGELVPLLQIAPSKTDAERLLVINPELADVLSHHHQTDPRRQPGRPARRRLRRPRTPLAATRPGALPAAHRRREPRHPCRHRAQAARLALTRTGLTGADGAPLHYTLHDFRRMFLTDVIMSGLPPHIAQIIAGHRDINVTLGYKAVYPEEAIQAHLAFLARRRAQRPSEEYRTPTDAEWEEFLGHFERRKVATGTCGRAFGTPCIHEHSCLRCPMHWPDPAQRDRIAEIRDNLTARITEAEREGWLGEVEGLKVSLAGAEDKLAQIDRRTRTTAPVELGMPALTSNATRH